MEIKAVVSFGDDNFVVSLEVSSVNVNFHACEFDRINKLGLRALTSLIK